MGNWEAEAVMGNGEAEGVGIWEALVIEIWEAAVREVCTILAPAYENEQPPPVEWDFGRCV